VAAVAGRADAAALAGEGHDESRAARRADRAGEAEAEEPAREIAAEFVRDVSRHGPLGGFPGDHGRHEFGHHHPGVGGDVAQRRAEREAQAETADQDRRPPAVAQVGAGQFGHALLGVVLPLVYSLGDISGCHINPAITLGLWAAGRFDRASVLPYLASQCGGAILASGLLRLLFPQSPTLGATLPAGSAVQSLVLEGLLTLILTVVVLTVSADRRDLRLLAGVIVGGVIGLEALFAGPISGASMNPARSLAPAVVAMQLGSLWIYLLAPAVGALAGVPLCRCLRPGPCCGPCT
jgi:MIP family channel proteins